MKVLTSGQADTATIHFFRKGALSTRCCNPRKVIGDNLESQFEQTVFAVLN